MKGSHLPMRLLTGIYILHSGMEKWNGDEETAQGLHGVASGAYPFIKDMEPSQFLRLLSVGEMAIGAAVATPFVSPRLAGAMLTGFSGGLLGLYFRTPGMRKEGSIWPTQDGIALAKDVWLLGIGLSLLAEKRPEEGEGELPEEVRDEAIELLH